MARFVFGLNQSLDGYVDHQEFAPGPLLFRHFIEHVRDLAGLGLINAYRLYLRPVVLGRGKPFFVSARPALRLAASDRIGEDAVKLTYVPA
jgi:hypothetical protein